MSDLLLIAIGALVLFMVCGPMMFEAFRQPTKTEEAVVTEN